MRTQVSTDARQSKRERRERSDRYEVTTAAETKNYTKTDRKLMH